jgi:hypothetical protein
MSDKVITIKISYSITRNIKQHIKRNLFAKTRASKGIKEKISAA